LSFGDWEGQTLSRSRGDHSPAADRGNANAASGIFARPATKAESYAMLAERTDRFLASVNRPTICVAHGGVIRTLFQRIGKVAR
jgi:broad specificity phosphatase PhoE